ncbi:MAG: hypothetical protein J0L67_20985 [Cytophagales bacterium]|jgi:uncharacterized protein (TIGR02145 family)|nr:hypothetical protein [Cytophagales bacterium]
MKVFIFSMFALLISFASGYLKKDNVFTDPRDKHKYKIVQSDGNYWFAENLRYKPPGDSLTHAFNSSEENLQKHGLLYSLSSAKLACPPGWRLPSKQDWNRLMKQVPGSLNTRGGRIVEEKKVSDSTFLNISLAGFRTPEGKDVAFNRMTIFWTSSDTVSTNNPDPRFNGNRFIGYHFYKATTDSLHAEPTYANSAAYGYYCRCIKNKRN